MRLATRWNLKSRPSACVSSYAGQANTAMPARPSAIRPRKIAKLRMATGEPLLLEGNRLVAVFRQQLEQSVVPDEVQRADHDEHVLVAIEQRLDLRQPLAIARA